MSCAFRGVRGHGRHDQEKVGGEGKCWMHQGQEGMDGGNVACKVFQDSVRRSAEEWGNSYRGRVQGGLCSRLQHIIAGLLVNIPEWLLYSEDKIKAREREGTLVGVKCLRS